MKNLFTAGFALAWMFANYVAVEYALKELHATKAVILAALVVVNFGLYLGLRALQNRKVF